jgi:hypothetical protein
MQFPNSENEFCGPHFKPFCALFRGMSKQNDLNPCLVHPVALAINKKNETPLFATVFVVLSILLHVSAYIGHLQVFFHLCFSY